MNNLSKDIKENQLMDAVEYTKLILKMSSSIEEILLNSNEMTQINQDEFKNKD